MKLPDYLTEASSKDLEEMIKYFTDIEGEIDGAFYEFTGESLDGDEFPQLNQACVWLNQLIHALEAQREEAIAREDKEEEEERNQKWYEPSLSAAERNPQMIARARRF